MTQKHYKASDLYEEVLMEVSKHHKDAKGKVKFQLNEDKYLSWFDPFYFIAPPDFSKG